MLICEVRWYREPKIGKDSEDEASASSGTQENRYFQKGSEHFNILSTCVVIPVPTSSILALPSLFLMT